VARLVVGAAREVERVRRRVVRVEKRIVLFCSFVESGEIKTYLFIM